MRVAYDVKQCVQAFVRYAMTERSYVSNLMFMSTSLIVIQIFCSIGNDDKMHAVAPSLSVHFVLICIVLWVDQSELCHRVSTFMHFYLSVRRHHSIVECMRVFLEAQQ